jgi:HPt (histidine-containing phosphotransfer) domain-containing protein
MDVGTQVGTPEVSPTDKLAPPPPPPAPAALATRDTPAAFAATGLSSILDIDRGLRQCGGRAAFYRKVLLKFTQSQRDTEASLEAALADARWGDLHRESNTIKSVATYIGASELQAAAQALEQACLPLAQAMRSAAVADATEAGSALDVSQVEALRALTQALRGHLRSLTDALRAQGLGESEAASDLSPAPQPTPT